MLIVFLGKELIQDHPNYKSIPQKYKDIKIEINYSHRFKNISFEIQGNNLLSKMLKPKCKESLFEKYNIDNPEKALQFIKSYDRYIFIL